MQMKPLFQKVVTLLLFIFVYFAITSNPIVRPKASEAPGLWSIEKAQTPLALGFAAHNYLLLRNEQGIVERELHGLPTNNDGSFVKVSLVPGRTLNVLEFEKPLEGARDYRPSAITLYSGTREDAQKKWREGKACAEKINKESLPYPALGIKFEQDTVNSNSVATTLLSCMNLPSPHVGLFTPGSRKMILDN